jgi:hypothetical protein
MLEKQRWGIRKEINFGFTTNPTREVIPKCPHLEGVSWQTIFLWFLFLYGDLKLKESCHCSFMLQSYEIMANPQNYSLPFLATFLRDSL